MVSYPAINLVDSVIDEVALEGLDGITLEALWQRLAHRFNDPLPLSKPFMSQIWSICVQVQQFKFYKLETPRGKLVVFDRYEHVDLDLGIIIEPDIVPEDVYPHCPVEDASLGIKGSCSSYYTREDISNEIRSLSVFEADEKYGQSLAIVASQYLRESALMGSNVCSTLELSLMQYCFLERVGRSRYHGEVTQGKLSLHALKEDPKSLFYHRKLLLKYKLITKQIYHQRQASHTSSGSLLHLTRFFVERKPKVVYLAEQVIDILKNKENYIAEYSEIKKKLQIEKSFKLLLKTSFFQKIVGTELVPYRTLYPNAGNKEYTFKNDNVKEKMIRAVRLLNPNIDIAEEWAKDDVPDDEVPFEIDISRQKLRVPYMTQANREMEKTEKEGISLMEMAQNLGAPKLQTRTILRNLFKAGVMVTYLNDMGRQRIVRHVSKKFYKSSKRNEEFEKEMTKIRKLVLTKNTDSENAVLQDQSNLLKVEAQKESEPEKNEISPTISSDMKPDTEEIKTGAEDVAKKQNIFQVVNKILKRYKLHKCVKSYKCTSGNFTSAIFDKSITENEVAKTDNGTEEDVDVLNEEDARFFNNIKTVLITQKPLFKRNACNTSFMKRIENDSKTTCNVTSRLLKRANMIIEAVKEHQVIDDLTKFIKEMNIEEEKEGYDSKIDKKSLIRLLQQLAKDNVIKNIKLTLSAYGKEKSLIFICSPNIDIDHAVIQSAIEQAKLKFCLLVSSRHRKGFRNIGKIEDTPENNEKSKMDRLENQDIHSNFKYDLKEGKKYGFSPKFLRMQTLHIFLYYLIYEHRQTKPFNMNEQIEKLVSSGIDIDDKTRQQMSPIYNSEVSWKMFVPPLPEYYGRKEGWAILCDVLFRMPLSIFLKVHNVALAIPELDYYLSHSIRRNFLIKNLPLHLRNLLLVKRKYLFTIHETLTRLCYIGLVQFGPQKFKEKDQVFLYLNRNTEIMNTRTSAAGYHIIEDKTYKTQSYHFHHLERVREYWYDLWDTCINTRLGGRTTVQGKDIVLEDLTRKKEMIESTKARTPEEAIANDNGTVPGDRKGAAGLDSAFFAHLKRNWNWNSLSPGIVKQNAKVKNAEHQRSKYLSKIEAKPLNYAEFVGLKKVTGPTTVSASDLRKHITKKANTAKLANLKKQKCEVQMQRLKTKQKSFVRRVLPKKNPVRRRRVKYDEIDYCALQRMNKLRVDWEPYEDNILLVCKVAMMYLCPNPRKQLISFTTVRDTLRSYSLTSSNKTSRACQRRLLYMLRKPQTVNSVDLGVEEIKQNVYVQKRFGGEILDKLKEESDNPNVYEEKVAEVFKELVSYVIKKYYNITDMEPKEPMTIPSTIQEYNLLYKLIHPTKSLNNNGFTKDVQSEKDILSATINSVIHSSMCCGKDRRSWAYQLFRVYQQYPEYLLRNGMAKIRSDKLVSIKKNYMTAMKKYGNCIPMSSSQYQLSTTYVYKFMFKWPYYIFRESCQLITKLCQWYHENLSKTGTEILPVTGGIVLGVHDFINEAVLDFDIEIPEHIIMLDPRLQEKDETYFKIAQRYQDILSSLDQSLPKKDAPVESNANRDHLNYLHPSTNNKIEPSTTKKNPDNSVSNKNVGIKSDFTENKSDNLFQNQSNESNTLLSKKRPIERVIEEGKEEEEEEEEIHSDAKKLKTVSVEDDIGSNLSVAEEVENLDGKLEAVVKEKDSEIEVSRRIDLMKLDDCEIRGKYTRIALLRMREELSELSVSDSHHAHEFFAVNTFKIIFSLDLQKQLGDYKTFQSYKVPSKMVPFDSGKVQEILNGIKKHAVFPQNHISLADFKKDITDNYYISEENIDTVYNYVQSKKELGTSMEELLQKFYLQMGKELCYIVEALTDRQLFLRSGVTIIRFIHHRYVDPWLIQSYKIFRLEQESLPAIPQGSLYCMDDDKYDDDLVNNENDAENLLEDNEMSCRKRRRLNSSMSKADANSNDDKISPKRMLRKRTSLLHKRDIYRAARLLDLNTAEERKVVIRPWITVDGELNRRVLDRMLGAILIYCMLHPGVNLLKVQSKFVPALQPLHTRELVETLVKLGCLEMNVLRKSQATLFSKPQPLTLEATSNWVSEGELVIEPTTSATLKYAIFLSDRKYATDFI